MHICSKSFIKSMAFVKQESKVSKHKMDYMPQCSCHAQVENERKDAIDVAIEYSVYATIWKKRELIKQYERPVSCRAQLRCNKTHNTFAVNLLEEPIIKWKSDVKQSRWSSHCLIFFFLLSHGESLYSNQICCMCLYKVLFFRCSSFFRFCFCVFIEILKEEK